MREKADSDLVRRQNRLLLMEALRQHGGMSCMLQRVQFSTRQSGHTAS